MHNKEIAAKNVVIITLSNIRLCGLLRFDAMPSMVFLNSSLP